MSFKIKLIVLIVGWLIVVFLGLGVLKAFSDAFLEDIQEIYNFVKDNLGLVAQIMDLFL